MNKPVFRILSWLCGLSLLAGCASQPEVQRELEQARGRYQSLVADPAMQASASKDAARAADSLERAERLADYWGSAEDVAHYAFLSQRYTAIAREHATQAAERQQLERLQLERERLLLAVRESTLLDLQRTAPEDELVNLAASTTERGLVVSLGDVLFDPGRAVLKPEANRIVLRLYRFLKLHPQRRVRIEGYSDSQGKAADNLQLSQGRAQGVADVLVDLGIDARRIEVRGYGEAFPLAANASSYGRAQNRRVEIVFSDEQGQLGPERASE